MSQSLAFANAWNLATTLMVYVVVFTGMVGYGVMPATEHDGDPADAIHEFDPFPMRKARFRSLAGERRFLRISAPRCCDLWLCCRLRRGGDGRRDRQTFISRRPPP
ncbi:hypothetical protein HZZ13_14720 [Bradyrhizobium sp. CNPSo 4010]|uniref:Uncharacterized protein n=1 Tax=Bradyrhizobium agreste TaxID=2751811 RepID=A0ABS0PQ97_9BRAD|nr:hypothetical protein [Bradyrhizobium agreste]MBH5399019.1 hypothetical protein [Bradyrhizobium agreste]